MSEWIMDPTQNGPVLDDISYSEYKPSIANLIPPYPSSMWGKRQGVNGPVMPNMQQPEYRPSIANLIYPYPKWLWHMDEQLEGPSIGDVMNQGSGAFRNCVNLSVMNIPASVSELGWFTFQNTNLTNVKIAPDCYYVKSTFPSNCVKSFYDYTETHTNPSKTVYDLNEPFDSLDGQLNVTVVADTGEIYHRSYTHLSARGFDSTYTGDIKLSVGRMNVRFDFDVTIDGGDYVYENDAATLLYTGNNTKVCPPKSMYGHPLPDVELYTFMDNTQITHAIIRDGIEAIY